MDDVFAPPTTPGVVGVDSERETPDGGSANLDANAPPGRNDDSAADASGIADHPPSDASSARPVVPAWAEGIEGKYAFRTRLFAQEDRVVVAGDAVGFAVFAAVGDKVQVQLESCDAVSHTELSSMRVTYPQLLPPRVFVVEFTETSWSAKMPKPIAAGFSYDVPETCRGSEGRLVPKEQSQTWIRSDKCECPLNAESALKSDDCRVRDIDGDGAPGFRLDGSGAASGVYGGAILFKQALLDGLRGSDGSLTAFTEDSSVHYQLSGTSPVRYTDHQPCSARQHPTEFVPIPADTTCTTLLAQRATLFRVPLAAPPSTCR